MATYNAPSVPTFSAGYGYLANDLNSLWYQTSSFFQNRIVLRVSQGSAATTLSSSGAAALITFDTVLEDPYSGWNASTHLWTPPTGYSGWFDATITIRTAAASALVDLRVILAGSTPFSLGSVQASASTGAGVCGTFRTYLIGGQDNVGAQAQIENSAGNLNTSITAGQQSSLELVWISQT